MDREKSMSISRGWKLLGISRVLRVQSSVTGARVLEQWYMRLKRLVGWAPMAEGLKT